MRIDSAIITGSFSVNGDTFNDLGSYSTTGSNTFVGNQSIVGAVSASAFTGSINYTNITNVPTLVSGSEQIVSILSPLNSFTASNSTTNTFTSSATARLNSIETITASNVARLTSLEAITGSLATTGSNTFIGTQTITGSLFISSNLIVQGTSSLQNITASAVSIGTNLINLNTANPAIRYAGLSIGDSGSVGGSGSFLYDSVQDEMIFVHRGASTVVTSSVVLMGPQTFDNIGSETYPTLNIVQKGTGNEHLGDSCIFDNGTTICVKNNLIGTGTIQIGGASISGNSNSFYNATNETSVAIKQTCGGAQIGLAVWNDGTTGDNRFIRFFGETSATNRGSIHYDRTGNRLNLIGEGCGLLLTGATTLSSTVNAVGLLTGQASIYQSDAGGLIASNRWGTYNGGSTAMSFLYNGSGNVVWDNGTQRMVLTNTGNLGIGIASPASALDVLQELRISYANANQYRVRIYNTDGNGRIFVDGDESALIFGTSAVGTNATATEKMRITSRGNVGINTASPNTSSPLHVKMCSNSNGDGIRVQAICSGGAGSQPGIAFSNTSDCKRWNIAMDTNSDTFQITNAGGSNVFNVTQNCVVCLGPVTIVGMQGGADNTVISGGSGYGSAISMKYANGAFNNYLAGNGDNFFNCITGKLNAQGGIKFGGGATTLNHYESGTWTPQLYWSGGGQYCMSGINGGNYVRIGNVVHINYHLQWSALCGSSGFGGQLRIGGLPYAVGGYRSAGTISAISSGIGRSVTGITYHALTVDPGQNFIYWIENDPTGGYSHSPSVGASGLVYSNQVTYTLH